MVAPTDGEQRNRYEGEPPTPWVRVRFARADGRGYIERSLAVDTGDDQAARIDGADMRLVGVRRGPIVQTNFGSAIGGWVLLSVPDVGLQHWILSFATDELVDAVRQLSPSFAGQVGMQFLRMVEYGGNDHEFWIRRLRSQAS